MPNQQMIVNAIAVVFLILWWMVIWRFKILRYAMLAFIVFVFLVYWGVITIPGHPLG